MPRNEEERIAAPKLGMDRRQAIAFAFGGLATSPLAASTHDNHPGQGATSTQILPAQRDWDPIPPPAPETARLVDLGGGVRLWCRDTGGSGEAVVLLHPATGSADIWGYQQPYLAAHGYRVIAYSRRGHLGSKVDPAAEIGTGADDLQNLANALKIGRFHLVGFAAGGFIVPDYALSYPERLLSITLACTQGGVQDAAFRARIAAMTPPALQALPDELMELSPSFRAGNPEGTVAWTRMAGAAVPGKRIIQPLRHALSWQEIEKLRVAALLVAGAADLYMPPPLMLAYARHVAGAETAILSECGHSGYWEQPRAFNRLLLDFLTRHREIRNDAALQTRSTAKARPSPTPTQSVARP